MCVKAKHLFPGTFQIYLFSARGVLGRTFLNYNRNWWIHPCTCTKISV